MHLSGRFVADHFIDGVDADSVRDISYDLNVAKIVRAGEILEAQIILKPQEMVVLISQERVIVPEGYVGYAFPKTGLCQEGILVLNTGIIDPGYSGLISTVAINFRNSSYCIRPGDSFLRLVYQQVERVEGEPDTPNWHIDDQTYIDSCVAQSRMYPGTFLAVDENIQGLKREVEEETKKSVWESVANRLVLGVTVVAFVLVIFQWLQIKSFHDVLLEAMSTDRIDQIESRLDEVEHFRDPLVPTNALDGGGDRTSEPADPTAPLESRESDSTDTSSAGVRP